MKRVLISLLLLTCSISFCMAQNIREAKQREVQEQQETEALKRQQQQAAEAQRQLEAQQQQFAIEEQKQREAQQPVIKVTSDGTLIRGSSLSAIFDWLNRNVESHNTYIVELIANDNISPQMLQYKGAINITIILRGYEENRTIRLNSHGTMFTVPSNVTFVLSNNITLMGHSQNTGSMVKVDGGIFKMNIGSIITGNTSNAYQSSGGVFVSSGNFEMTGGSITNNASTGQTANHSNSGGGVSVCDFFGKSTGIFTMSGGVIANNSAHSGGGVHVSGNFTMNGGTISNNNANSGGGVYVSGGNFTMRSGNITGNTASAYGGGVYTGRSNFTKVGGSITGYNSDQSNGNKVADYEGIIARRGHTVYVNENMRKETTAGPGMNLSGSNADNWGDSPMPSSTSRTIVENEQTINSDVIGDNEPAVLYIYRKRKALDLFPKRYDIFLDNVVVGNSNNNWKTTMTVNTFGTKTLSATIDGRKAEIRNNFQPSGVYYIRSGVDSKSIETGRNKIYTNKNGKTTTSKETEMQYIPTLQLVDTSIGEPEFKAIK